MMVFRYFILFFLLLKFIFAGVNVQIPDSFISGEPLVFSVEYSGNDIQKPDLSSIDGFTTQNMGNYTSVNSINGTTFKKSKLTYAIYANKDVNFPALKFVVDGKEYTTKAKKVLLKLPSKTKSDVYSLEIEANKDEVYIGEKFELKVKFKIKEGIELLEPRIETPSSNNFWLSQDKDYSKKYKEGNFVVFELKFLLSPLKTGLQKIQPFVIQAKKLDYSDFSFFSDAKIVKVYSNTLDINVKQLPQNVNLIGNFDISSSVDKTEVKKGEAVKTTSPRLLVLKHYIKEILISELNTYTTNCNFTCTTHLISTRRISVSKSTIYYLIHRFISKHRYTYSLTRITTGCN